MLWSLIKVHTVFKHWNASMQEKMVGAQSPRTMFFLSPHTEPGWLSTAGSLHCSHNLAKPNEKGRTRDKEYTFWFAPIHRCVLALYTQYFFESYENIFTGILIPAEYHVMWGKILRTRGKYWVYSAYTHRCKGYIKPKLLFLQFLILKYKLAVGCWITHRLKCSS